LQLLLAFSREFSSFKTFSSDMTLVCHGDIITNFCDFILKRVKDYNEKSAISALLSLQKVSIQTRFTFTTNLYYTY
jgi:hypothetical protein